MPFINADRIKETTITTGTGPLTLAGAVVGFRSFLLAPMATNDTCPYAIVSATGLESEAGIGTFTSPNILTRTTVQSSSNGNAAVNFSAGVKDVFIGPIAGTQVPYDPVTGTLGLGVNALNDVAITSPTVNQVLKYSGTEWTNQADSVNVGTVTIVSVASANGFGGTVADPNTTPAITLTTSITGLLKGNASAILAAVAGTDYVTPSGSVAYATSAGYATNAGNAATVTTNANLTGHITSVGNAAVLGSFTSAQLYAAVTDRTGTGGAAVFADSPTLVTPFSNTLSAIPVVSGAGNSLTIAAGSGAGTTGTNNGGNLILNPGEFAAGGTRGTVLIDGVNAGKGKGTVGLNTVFGVSALGAITTGYSNTVVGAYALKSNVTGYQNAAFGEQSLDACTNSENTAFGYYTLRTLTSGVGNTVIGSMAGADPYIDGLTTGGNNVLVGRRATTGPGNNGVSNCIVIGALAVGNGSNTTTIGTTSTTVAHLFGRVIAKGGLTTPVLTVATLPAAATSGAGTRSFVSDATLTTFATPPIGGGGNGVPVYSDGANWYIG